jgi:hypothetical protein
VPYAKLGRTLENPELFVGIIEGSGMPVQPPSLARALETIIGHAGSQEPSVPGYVAGLAAYDTWVEAFESNRVQPVGHAYQIALLTEARQHAVLFLNKWKEHPAVSGDSDIARLWQDALEYYRSAHRSLTRLYPSFPYGMPGVRIDIREQSVRGLRQAQEAEKNGIKKLEQIYSSLNQFS